MGYISSLVLLFLLIILTIKITSASDNDGKKEIRASSIKRPNLGPRGQRLPSVHKLREQRQSKSQVNRKAKPTNVALKWKKIKSIRKLKNKGRHLGLKNAKDKSETASRKRKVYMKQRKLKTKPEMRRSKKVQSKTVLVRKKPIRKVSKKKIIGSKTILRKKSRPAKDDHNVVKNKDARLKLVTKPTVTTEKPFDLYDPEVQARITAEIELRKNMTKFYETVAGPEYKIYKKCERESPRIVPTFYEKLHEGHVPAGHTDCRNEINAVYEKILDYSKAAEKDKHKMWQTFQGKIIGDFGRPKKCKQWRYGTDC